jgi:hypothetical protein
MVRRLYLKYLKGGADDLTNKGFDLSTQQLKGEQTFKKPSIHKD